MKYDKFKYIYPPRPEHKTSPDKLDTYDNGEYIAQPKYNGSCCIVFTNGKELAVYNRHHELLNLLSNYKEIDFKALSLTNNWFVYAGEYLNKSKLSEHGTKDNNKFIIWDVLVHDGNYLIGETLQKRLELLENTFPCQRAVVKEHGNLEIYNHLCLTNLNGIYKAPSYLNNFQALYNDLVKVDVYEGLVLKKKESKLTYGFQELNNHEWQIKARKATKIYNF